MKSTLSSLASNVTVEIVQIEDCADKKRMESMGITVGAKVKVLKSGNPILLKVDDDSYGLSAKLANSVIVQS